MRGRKRRNKGRRAECEMLKAESAKCRIYGVEPSRAIAIRSGKSQQASLDMERGENEQRLK